MFGPLKISATAVKKTLSNTAASTPEQGPTATDWVPLSSDYLPEAYITGAKILGQGTDDVDGPEIASKLSPILRSSSSQLFSFSLGWSTGVPQAHNSLQESLLGTSVLVAAVSYSFSSTGTTPSFQLLGYVGVSISLTPSHKWSKSLPGRVEV
ncbi:hypothetical protein FOZ63_015474 [Perkinsus olseni]|uniref:Uncharacterized protein n=1 Tax=Perkinsus olseni TaxID=32597 RepID=A0A7J6SE84_PEROL|nr:hypothetical protein FOZ63_015474 [Perkinsus olseni]